MQPPTLAGSHTSNVALTNIAIDCIIATDYSIPRSCSADTVAWPTLSAGTRLPWKLYTRRQECIRRDLGQRGSEVDLGRDGDTQVTGRRMGRGLQQEVLAQLEAI
jgi:hypothetical protein